jgi:wxcM family protein
MKKYKLLNFPQLGDERGHLVVVEGNKDIPFEIKRIFYIYGSDKDVIRGQHANRLSEFVLINISGRCNVFVDDGENQETVILDKPYQGIYLNKMVWKNMLNFSKDAILLVLSNEYYNSEEYIRDYEEFKKIIREKK